MSPQICLFEDNYFSRFLPLVYFRPVYDLKCGGLSLKEKIQRRYRSPRLALHCRSYLADFVRHRNPRTDVNKFSGGECLFINGRVIADENFVRNVALKGPSDIVYMSGKDVVAARVSEEVLTRWNNKLPEVFSSVDFEGIAKKEVDAVTVKYPWDLIHHNAAQLRADWALLSVPSKGKKISGKISAGVHLINKKNIMIGSGSLVKPGVVIDAENGPVYIGNNVTVLPQSTIIGPVYIGDGSIIRVGAKIYEDTAIGPMCKIGGEVEASIIHGYSNKQHDGFLGHSYLGEWVNLGAGTTNSDLKNNYSSVRVVINGESVDSGSLFVGATIGDHTKTAINTVLNTGTVVGVSCNVFGEGVPPKFIPSFSWGGSGEASAVYDVARAAEVAKRVMSRRKVSFSDVDAALFEKIFELAKSDRRHVDARH